MLRRTLKLDRATVLRFAEPLDLIPVDNVTLAVCSTTGNWLVLHEDQKNWLDSLRAGKTVGAVLDQARSLGAEASFKSLLGQISARQYAGINTAPSLSLDDPRDGIHIYLTNACNLSCTHCYMYSGKALKNELSANEWKNVLTEFARLGGKTVTFSGGEVTTKTGWLEVLRHAHGLGLKITVLTNGTLWKVDDIEAASALITEIQVSVDGPNEKSNALVRGAGAFHPAVETAIAFANKGVRTSIAMTPTFENLDDLAPGIRSFAESLFERTSGPLFIKIGSGLIAGRSGPAPEESQQQHYREVAQSASDQIYNDSTVRNFSLGHTSNHGFSNCGFGGLALSADGGAYPCNRIAEVDTEGSVRNTELGQLLTKITDLQKKTSVDNVEPCRNCEIRYVCGGGCRIEEFSFKGRIHNNQTSEPGADDRIAPIKQITCNEEQKKLLYRKMIAATRYQYALDA